MSYTLNYYDEVSIDIKEAKDWYKNQKPGLEKRFAQQVKKSLLRLQNNPKGYEIRHKDIRTAFTDIFPYAIHFYLNEQTNTIVIIAILHQSRNPKLKGR